MKPHTFIAILSAAAVLTACGTENSSSPDASGASTFFPSNGASLHYALDLPSGAGPFPAVVLGHGSGAVTLSEGAAHVPYLTGAGFAVLRYDKRGAGLSTGIYRGLSAQNSETQVAELADDMVAGVNFLKTRREVDARRVGLAGVSQAGWIMIAGAQRSRDVRFIVAIVGSTTPVGKNVFYEGLPVTASLDANYAALAAFNGFPGWDPVPVLRDLQIPAIWVLGAEDRLVPTRHAQRTIDALRSEGHRYHAVVYQGFGHELSGAGALYWPEVFAWMAAEGLR